MNKHLVSTLFLYFAYSKAWGYAEAWKRSNEIQCFRRTHVNIIIGHLRLIHEHDVKRERN